jgi:hypothetical protein
MRTDAAGRLPHEARRSACHEFEDDCLAARRRFARPPLERWCTLQDIVDRV